MLKPVLTSLVLAVASFLMCARWFFWGLLLICISGRFCIFDSETQRTSDTQAKCQESYLVC